MRATWKKWGHGGVRGLMHSVLLMRASRPRGVGRLMTVFLVMLVALVAVVGGGAWYAQSTLDDVPTFDDPGTSAVGPAEEAPPLELPEQVTGDPKTYLLFSTGATGMDEAEARSLGVTDLAARGADKLTDTIMLVVLAPGEGSASVLSIPRDTWIEEADSKINAIYPSDGPQALADAVTGLTGLPVNHMVSVDFAGFASLTDAVGGISVYAEHPLRDAKSKLDIPESGCTLLDGKTVLAWVRSRYTEYQDVSGTWRSDPSASDFGRIERQHAFLRQVLRKMSGPQLVTQVPGLVGVAKDHLLIDENLGTRDIVGLAQAFASSDPEAVEMYSLPSEVGRVGRASVVFIDEEATRVIVDRLQAQLAGENQPPVPSPSPSTTQEPNPGSATSAAPPSSEVVPSEADPIEGTTPVPPAC